MLKTLGRSGTDQRVLRRRRYTGVIPSGAGLVDELVVFSAGAASVPKGKPSVGQRWGIAALADAPRFDLVEVRRVRNDVMQKWASLSP